MFVRHHSGGKVFLWEWRLCRHCCRMFNLNTKSFMLVVEDGDFYHAHIVCPPLKQQPLKLLGKK